jgi:hypothetical protein
MRRQLASVHFSTSPRLHFSSSPLLLVSTSPRLSTPPRLRGSVRAPRLALLPQSADGGSAPTDAVL